MRVLGEDTKLEFRVDTYNLFNKLNINTSSIDNTLGSVNSDGSVQSVNKTLG